jgi:hypothetical protein
MSATIKLCAYRGGRTQLRRARVKSLDAFTFAELQSIAADVFPDASPSLMSFCFEGANGTTAVVCDRDLRACCELAAPADRRILRLVVNFACDDEKATAAKDAGKTDGLNFNLRAQGGSWRVATVALHPRTPALFPRRLLLMSCICALPGCVRGQRSTESRRTFCLSQSHLWRARRCAQRRR